MRSSGLRGRLGGVAALLLALVLLAMFAPRSLGGSFSYAIVSGNSMAPLLETDDVVLLRGHGGYAVGDIVAYRHPQIGNVLHRIAADDGERFTMRGDNLGGNDSYQPLHSEVIGRQWAVIPGGGRVLRAIQEPRNAALLALAAIAVVAAGASVSAARRRPRVPLRAAGAVADSLGEISAYAPTGRALLGVAVAVGLGCFALLALWRIEGATRPSSEQLRYQERGQFSYGRLVEGGVYDFDTLAPPEPLFRRLLDDLPLRYDYTLDAAEPGSRVTNVLGSYDVIAVVGNESGWKRTFTLVPLTLLAGDRLEASATIDLGALDRQLATIAEATGIAHGVHALRVVARVHTRGEIDGLPFQRSSEQSLQFRLTELQLTFDADGSQLELLDSGSVTRQVAVPRVLSSPLLPLSLDYARIPALAFGGLVLATIGGFVVGFATVRTTQDGEAAQIRARFGRALVDLADPEHAIGPKPVAVGRIEDLVRIAEAEGVAIMHHAGSHGDEYFVVARDVTWRYASWAPRLPRPQLGGELINATEG